jgi:hypothetical protein
MICHSIAKNARKRPGRDVPSCSELAARFEEVQVLRKLVAEYGDNPASRAGSIFSTIPEGRKRT